MDLATSKLAWNWIYIVHILEIVFEPEIWCLLFECKVMEVLMSLQGSQLETDDPTTSYMLQVCFYHLKFCKRKKVAHGALCEIIYNVVIIQAWARLCKCLGQDFLPYMSVVMPPLLQSAQLKPDVTITSADSDNEIEDSDDERSELRCIISFPLRWGFYFTC